MPKNRKLQNIIGTEHITDSAEAAIAAQATVGDIVGDTTPQLGGNLDVNGNDIVSVSNGDIELAPNGTGQVIFKGNSTKGAGQFKLNCEVNTHGIIIKGPPHSAAASYTLTLPNTDGSADQVLKTDGAGNLDWVAQSGGGGQIAHAQHLSVPVFSANSGLVSVHPLLAAGNAGNSLGTNGEWIGTTNTEIHFFPCVMQETGTLATMQYRIGNQAGDTLYLALYASDTNGLPTGSPTFTHTNSSTATNTSYNLTPNVSGITRGDLIYFAAFGQSTRTFLFATDVTDGGTFSVPRGLSAVNYSAGVDYQSFKLGGQTNGVFPTLSASTNYTGHATHSYVARIGITFT